MWFVQSAALRSIPTLSPQLVALSHALFGGEREGSPTKIVSTEKTKNSPLYSILSSGGPSGCYFFWGGGVEGDWQISIGTSHEQPEPDREGSPSKTGQRLDPKLR